MQNNPRIIKYIKKPIFLGGCMVLIVFAYFVYVFHRTTNIFPFPTEFILSHFSFLYNIFIGFNLAFYNKRLIYFEMLHSTYCIMYWIDTYINK